MATSPEYRDYVLELLNPIEPVRARSMFGGIGLYARETMFALITSDDELYFKADDSNRPDYEAADMSQFMKMPYFQVPGDVLEDSEALSQWVQKSIDVAIRTAKPKKKKKK